MRVITATCVTFSSGATSQRRNWALTGVNGPSEEPAGKTYQTVELGVLAEEGLAVLLLMVHELLYVQVETVGGGTVSAL